MAASLEELNRRIKSTKKTRQITSAMQMVSTSKLNRINRSKESYVSYGKHLEEIIQHLAKANIKSKNNLLNKRKIKKVGYLIITSDRGLVGGYNIHVIRKVIEDIEQRKLSKKDVVMISIGKNGSKFFKKRDYNIAYEYSGIEDIPVFDTIKEIVNKIVEMYETNIFDELVVVHNHFVTRIANEVKSKIILPIQIEKKKTISSIYDMEPTPEIILEEILPKYAQILIYVMMMDSKVAEHSASVTAMSAATDNAKDVIDSLNLKYNRARQSAITTEITEITGGMVALE